MPQQKRRRTHIVRLSDEGFVRYQAFLARTSDAGVLEAATAEPSVLEEAASEARPRPQHRSIHASLTESYVSRIRPIADTVLVYHDTRQPKLSMRVTVSGAHPQGNFAWRWSYRPRGNDKIKVLTIGAWPTWTADAALHKARRLQVALDEGADVETVLRPHRTEPAPVAAAPTDTFAQLFAEYERDRLDRLSNSHRINTTTRIAKYALPTLGDRPVKEINRRELADLLANIRETTGYERTTNTIATTLGSFFNYLVDRGVVATSPAARLPKTPERPRTQVLDLYQLVRVWRAAEALGYPTGSFVKLLLVVPARLREASELPRAEINTKTGLWTLPAARNKSERLFLLTLPPLAQDILNSCPDVGSKFYFTRTGKGAITGGFTHIKERLDREIAKQQDEPLPAWTFHDLRRSISTCMAELKVSQHIIDLVLNHGQKKLTSTYNQYSYLAEKDAAVRLWNSHFSAALAEAQARGPAREEVVMAAE